MNRLSITLGLSLLSSLAISAQSVDYSVVSVKEESGINFTKITNDNDAVCMPAVRRRASGCEWFSNRILGISVDGNDIAFVAERNNSTNIFIKDLTKQGGAIQRTHRQHVVDFNYSPDGKYICFSEINGKTTQLYQTDAKNGYVCRQITSGAQDYSPIHSNDMSQVFFARSEANSTSIWSHNIKDNFLSTYTIGMNPFPLSDNKSVICARSNDEGRSEIWRVNVETGIEECIVTDGVRSFTSPVVSPDGNWILFVGSNKLDNGTRNGYSNTDLFVCHLDGSQLTQLTYHAADDISPAWSRDGQYIYFISQRGSTTGVANIWRMNFNLK